MTSDHAPAGVQTDYMWPVAPQSEAVARTVSGLLRIPPILPE